MPLFSLKIPNCNRGSDKIPLSTSQPHLDCNTSHLFHLLTKCVTSCIYFLDMNPDRVRNITSYAMALSPNDSPSHLLKGGGKSVLKACFGESDDEMPLR